MLYLNDNKIEAKQLIEKFELEPIFYENGKLKTHITFQQTRGKQTDIIGGEPNYISPSLDIQKYFQATTLDGDTVEIRQSATSPRWDAGAKNHVYPDRRFQVQGNLFGFDLNKDLEMAVFFTLHPSNENSPFVKGKRKWKIQNLELEAQEKNAIVKAKKECYELIYKEGQSLETVRQIAAGMGIASTASSNIERLQQMLALKAEDNPIQFKDAWFNVETQFRGLLQVAKDKGVLVYKIVNGVPKWYFGQEQVCIVQNGEPEMDALINAILPEIHSWKHKLEQSVGGVVDDRITKALSKAEEQKDNTIKEKINDCIEADLIYHDRPQNAVFFVTKKGIGDKIIDVPEGSNWFKELEAHFEKEPKELDARWRIARRKQNQEQEQ